MIGEKDHPLKGVAKTHGLTHHPLHYNWCRIKNRCLNPKNQAYNNYGGRGITMCEEWQTDFKAFFDYMMALPHALESGYSVDRYPNNDGNYEPNNMRWATRSQQGLNKRVSKNNKTGYTGVYPHGNRFRSCIFINGKAKTIGRYDAVKEAVLARNDYIKNNLLNNSIQKI